MRVYELDVTVSATGNCFLFLAVINALYDLLIINYFTPCFAVTLSKKGQLLYLFICPFRKLGQLLYYLFV